MLALALLIALGTTGCSGSDASPADARRDRVEARLRATFSAAQARCIIDRADDGVLRALDRSSNLSPSSPALRAYSDLVVACVDDPDSTSPSSSTTTP